MVRLDNGDWIDCVYESGVGHKIYRSQDDGLNWEYIAYRDDPNANDGHAIVTDGVNVHVVISSLSNVAFGYYFDPSATTPPYNIGLGATQIESAQNLSLIHI